MPQQNYYDKSWQEGGCPKTCKEEKEYSVNKNIVVIILSANDTNQSLAFYVGATKVLSTIKTWVKDGKFIYSELSELFDTTVD